ncbi:TrgA family protein [Thalassorhabdomicrobium marinisediminis]|uniref:Tellurium resistance protein n=1 Tax=Thalassorhabdomicrobium marinisediminis TaxID=2170577 RepID=A0A2T7G1A6_9RHOB|nr:TrgA family protein [Thalassorhabdomicrobium marinisediminis]PVA08213.1 tellurium resistance protein [Thalassorhabdomicrobium marinisediminis]
MPTTGRFVGAVLFGALAWYTSLLIIPLFPEGTNLGWFQEVNTLFGLIAGWSVAGSRAGTGYVSAFSYGLTAMVAMVVMALFFNSTVVMIEQSLRRRYGGPGKAVTAVFELFMEYGSMMLTPAIVGTLVFGGIGAGLVVEFFAKRYP